MKDSDTAQFEMSQFGSSYMLAGIEVHLETAYEVCQCEYLLVELDRLEAWEMQHSVFYDLESVRERFAYLRQSILDKLAEAESFETQFYADKARRGFTLVQGGKKV